jgi:hypothetical protein
LVLVFGFVGSSINSNRFKYEFRVLHRNTQQQIGEERYWKMFAIHLHYNSTSKYYTTGKYVPARYRTVAIERRCPKLIARWFDKNSSLNDLYDEYNHNLSCSMMMCRRNLFIKMLPCSFFFQHFISFFFF